MANLLKHRFVSGVADSADASLVRPSNWNDGHVFSGGANGQVLVRDTTDATYGASWVAPSGVGGTVKFGQIITAGSQLAVDFTGIPSGYSALRLLFLSRDSSAGANVTAARLMLNNDGDVANYTNSARNTVANAVLAGTEIAPVSGAGGDIYKHPTDGNAAGEIASGEILIVGYALTTFHKRVTSTYGTDDDTTLGRVGSHSFRWKSLAAINRVTLTSGTPSTPSAFKDGSLFALYLVT